MSNVIAIPNSATVRMAKNFLARTDWSTDTSSKIVRFHPKWCHMQPWVIAALAAWGLAAKRAGVTVQVENPETAGYAWRFGLADYLDVEPGVQVREHEEAGRFVPLRTVRSRDDLGALMAAVVPLLHLAEEPEQARAVHYVLSEMVRNVLEHSDSRDGAVVCAQYYAGTRGGGRRYVSIGVADTGRGIFKSLSHNYPDLRTDHEAVLHAIRPGITGAVPGVYGTPNNAGAGLFYTRRLAEASDAYFAVGSGTAMFRTSTAEKRPADSNLAFPIARFPGTIVNVEFALEREVAFDDFLDLTGREFTQLDEGLRAKVHDNLRFT